MLEVSLSKQRDADDYQQAMRNCLIVNEQMQLMVENLLNLARADADQLRIVRESIDLAALVKACWQQLAERATSKQLRVDWSLANGCTLETDGAILRLVLQNILSNAVHHADDGGRVHIESITHNGQATLTVTNTGSQLSPNDVDHIFDRFWRGDTSRRASGHHYGLGLSLCKTLVEMLGGSIEATSSPDGIFKIITSLTRSTPPNEPDDDKRAGGW
jgi:signal transduction histidine kinase